MTLLTRRQSGMGFLCGVMIVLCLSELTAADAFKTPEKTEIATWLNVDWAPTFSRDMLEVYFTSWITSANLDIWSARREDVDLPWEDFQPLDVVNSPLEEDSPNLSPDGLTLTFVSSGLEGGFGAYDLWQTTRVSLDDPWQEPVNLGPVVNSRGGEGSPTISPDGLEIIFDQGCCHSTTLRRSTRPTLADPWSEPESMSTYRSEHEIGNAGYPSLSPDGLSLYFNRIGEFGQEDIFVSQRPALDAPFGPAENLGPTINTAGRDMMPRIAPDGSLYYVRNGVTGEAPWEIWRAEAETPWRPLVLEAGDADQDLDFDQFDLVRVAQTGKYLTGQPATWGEGDWDGAPGGAPGSPPSGNGLFDQLDIIVALAGGRYLQGPYAALDRAGQADDVQTSIGYDARLDLAEHFLVNDLTLVGPLDGVGDLNNVDLAYVPEPSTVGLAVIGLLGLVAGRLHQTNTCRERSCRSERAHADAKTSVARRRIHSQ